MAEHYFSYVFGQDGDLAAVPNTQPLSGTVNYDTGFTVGYELPNTDPGYLSVPRTQFNQIMNDVTGAIQQIQQTGFPSWITSQANNGTPYPYKAGAQVWFSGQAWYSLVDNNTAQPGTDATKWGLVTYNVAAFVTGDTVQTYNATLPSGWIWCVGSTIGNAASGADFRDTPYQALFNVLWASTPNTVCPLFTSTGTPVLTRGVSAAADWAANYRLQIPDERGRVGACADYLGGTAAGRLNNAASGGVDGTILGASGGEQNHALTSGENGAHSHAASSLTVSGAGKIKTDNNNEGVNYPISPAGIVSNTGPAGNKTNACQINVTSGAFGIVTYNNTNDPLSYFNMDGSGLSIAGSVNASGSGTAHNTVQPTIIKYTRIKL